VVSTGAANDLERDSELTRQMVTRFGMSERLGGLTYRRQGAARFLSSPFSAEERNYSGRTAEQIDEDARRIVDGSYQRVKTILTNRRAELERIADALITKETLTREKSIRCWRNHLFISKSFNRINFRRPSPRNPAG